MYSIILLSMLIMVCPAKTVLADGEEKTGLEISPNETLFDVIDMKPGDWATRSVIVRNTANEKFEYTFNVDDQSGEKLFNELMLEVSDVHGELYNGRLKDFKQIDSRSLDSLSEEELTMTIRFPEHLGNDFQGLDTHFSFEFVAEGLEDGNELAYLDGVIGSGGIPLKASFIGSPTTIIAGLSILGLCLANGWVIYLFYRKRKANM